MGLTTDQRQQIIFVVTDLGILAIPIGICSCIGTYLGLIPSYITFGNRAAGQNPSRTDIEIKPTSGAYPTFAPASVVPPTAVPPTVVPQTAAPPTAVPPTAAPPTAIPPTAAPPTAVPPTSTPTLTPTQIKTAIPLKVIEDFGKYVGDSQLQSTYVPIAAWGSNGASIHLGNVNGESTLRLDYDIRGTTANDNYVVLDRCFNPPQDWRGARYIEIWVQNDDKPKQVIVQFGEGIRCAGGDLSFEVWRTFVNLSPAQSGVLRLPFDSFQQETSWALSLNNQIDLNKIGYLALGIRGPAISQGSFHFGLIGLRP